MRIELLKEISSTNDYVRQYAGGGEDVIVCAERQTEGRGTKGRSFLSEKGGVYLSALTFYDDLPASEAFRIMAHAAVAVCKAVRLYGVSSEIKWPNDVYAGGKKLCGILIENEVAAGKVCASIVGIGLNVTNPLTGLEGTAVRLADLTAVPVSAEEVRNALIRQYWEKTEFSEYLSFVRFLGREIEVTEGAERYRAIARRILPDGRLEIEYGGGRRLLSAAEISVGITGRTQ